MTHRETVLNNIRIRIQKNCCKMHIARFRGRKYALLQLNSKNLKPSRQKQLTFPASKHRLRTTKLKRQQKEIKCFSPHNPFPDKQTSGFQIPHRLPPHGRPRYWPCGPPVGRKWWDERQRLCSRYTPASAFQSHLQGKDNSTWGTSPGDQTCKLVWWLVTPAVQHQSKTLQEDASVNSAEVHHWYSSLCHKLTSNVSFLIVWAASTNDNPSSSKPKTEPSGYVHPAQYASYNSYRQIYSLISPHKRWQTAGKQK